MASGAVPLVPPDPEPDADLDAALWRLLWASLGRDPRGFAREHDELAEVLAAASDPAWVAWRHAFDARRALLDADPDNAREATGAARTSLGSCPPTAMTALTLAYLAHVEAVADRVDEAMLLSVDASLLVEAAGGQPGRASHQAYLWLSLTLGALDLEQLAVAQAVHAVRIAEELDDDAARWQLLLLSAQQHVELAQTHGRRGEATLAAELGEAALECAVSARALDQEPSSAESDLLDVVQAWAMACTGNRSGALGPLRSAARRIHRDGPVWLRGYVDLALARLLGRLAADGAAGASADEAADLLVDAAGAFASTTDRRRYRQCLLELGQATAAQGRPAEALHWLAAYRAEAGRAHARGRELWAEMFVRRSRLREAERQAAVLRTFALEDPLTGLGNRRSAERRLSGVSPGEAPLSLAVVDVDRFKAVNDDASHSSGDEVLRRVADLLREHSRAGDEVYRWAGDEFLVVLPQASESQALLAMERLRAAVAGADWGDLPLPEPVTVSIGVATAPHRSPDLPEVPAGWQSLFDTADLHLFNAKRGGRNRVRARGAG